MIELVVAAQAEEQGFPVSNSRCLSRGLAFGRVVALRSLRFRQGFSPGPGARPAGLAPVSVLAEGQLRGIACPHACR